MNQNEVYTQPKNALTFKPCTLASLTATCNSTLSTPSVDRPMQVRAQLVRLKTLWGFYFLKISLRPSWRGLISTLSLTEAPNFKIYRKKETVWLEQFTLIRLMPGWLSIYPVTGSKLKLFFFFFFCNESMDQFTGMLTRYSFAFVRLTFHRAVEQIYIGGDSWESQSECDCKGHYLT